MPCHTMRYHPTPAQPTPCRKIWYNSIPSNITTRPPSSLVSRLPSLIHHPSSIIHHPSSTFYHPSALIHHPPSTIHHPVRSYHQVKSTQPEFNLIQCDFLWCHVM
jgi:hypothetical protein